MNKFRKQLLFFADCIILVSVAVVLSWFSLRYHIPDAVGKGKLLPHLVLLYVCTVLFQLLFRTYDSLWRYAESREYMFLLLAAVLGFCLYEVLIRFVLKISIISFLLLTAIASLWVLGMLLLRFIYRSYRSKVVYRRRKNQIPVAVVGAGAAGVQLLEELQSNPNSRYSVQCFFDDDPGKIGKWIHGVEVKGKISEIPGRLRAMDIREVLVAIPSLSDERRYEILRQLSGMERVKITVLPSTLELIGQESIHTQLREIQIEDLLERDPVELDPAPVSAFLEGKAVMVTGGGGSIGSELCRQIAKYQPRQLVIVDIYENNAYDIQQELRAALGDMLDLAVEIASVRDRERVRQLFGKYRPQIVLHAAAHKHVPLMETAPQEAVRNNVFGTLNLVETADEFGVENFILISSDKAVNPTSVMGATKRVCEMILQAMNGAGKTRYSAVRFGNVLGSNGSVVPLFKRQIAAGGPVTLTDRRIIRYFMTIPEAAQLVLQAAAMAEQNELYVLDMGKPVKILDLAENLIRLSGYVPYQDIQIVETGLRPGEKLYEELLVASRDIEKTENNKIFVERQPPITRDELQNKLDILAQALENNDPDQVRAALHCVVPTFYDPEIWNGSFAGETDAEQPRKKDND